MTHPDADPAGTGVGSRRVLLTGAAGFVGSHLADRLLDDGFEVVGVDDLSTGRLENLGAATSHPGFRLVVADASEPLPVEGPFEWVLHLASPASPDAYLARPIETLRINAEGTRHLLDLARRAGASFLLASSSEVYGDAAVHPQVEAYEGRVDPVAPRSVYQEAKRYAEALTAGAGRTWGVPTRIARIFNAYGPRMAPDDGRVVSSFIRDALQGRPLILHGDGSQTRSFQYVHDLTAGLRRLMAVDHRTPVNIGNPEERPVREVAELVLELTGSRSPIHLDPGRDVGARRRCPDISLARSVLHWQPQVSLRDGLARTVEHFRGELGGLPLPGPASGAAGAPPTGR